MNRRQRPNTNGHSPGWVPWIDRWTQAHARLGAQNNQSIGDGGDPVLLRLQLNLLIRRHTNRIHDDPNPSFYRIMRSYTILFFHNLRRPNNVTTEDYLFHNYFIIASAPQPAFGTILRTITEFYILVVDNLFYYTHK